MANSIPLDADLQRIFDAWPTLPTALKTGILAMIGAARKRLKGEHAATIAPLQTLAAEALDLERVVSDLVNAAYGLTPDEIKLMWDTAPPRMPLAAPGS